MATFDRLADLPLEIEGYELQGQEFTTGFGGDHHGINLKLSYPAGVTPTAPIIGHVFNNTIVNAGNATAGTASFAFVSAITAPTPAARHRKGIRGHPGDCMTYEPAFPLCCPSAGRTALRCLQLARWQDHYQDDTRCRGRAE